MIPSTCCVPSARPSLPNQPSRLAAGSLPPADPAAMAESIVMLLRSPDSSGRLGQHARERALELFATDRFAAAYRASYEKLTVRVFADERPAIVETTNVSEAPPMMPTAA